MRLLWLVLAGLLAATSASLAQQVRSGSAVPPQASAPATQEEWMRAAWAKMAQLKSVPPAPTDATGTYEVEVSILVRRDGSVLSARLRKPSGQPALDDHAVRLVMMASPLPPTPNDMSDVLNMTFPVVYDFGPEVWQRKRDMRQRNFASQR